MRAMPPSRDYINRLPAHLLQRLFAETSLSLEPVPAMKQAWRETLVCTRWSALSCGRTTIHVDGMTALIRLCRLVLRQGRVRSHLVNLTLTHRIELALDPSVVRGEHARDRQSFYSIADLPELVRKSLLAFCPRLKTLKWHCCVSAGMGGSDDCGPGECRCRIPSDFTLAQGERFAKKVLLLQDGITKSLWGQRRLVELSSTMCFEDKPYDISTPVDLNLLLDHLPRLRVLKLRGSIDSGRAPFVAISGVALRALVLDVYGDAASVSRLVQLVSASAYTLKTLQLSFKGPNTQEPLLYLVRTPSLKGFRPYMFHCDSRLDKRHCSFNYAPSLFTHLTSLNTEVATVLEPNFLKLYPRLEHLTLLCPSESSEINTAICDSLADQLSAYCYHTCRLRTLGIDSSIPFVDEALALESVTEALYIDLILTCRGE